ncbi:MAG TPA: PKD domain-containing protein [Planctomycetota bacterium]|jgi:hypothetical protein
MQVKVALCFALLPATLLVNTGVRSSDATSPATIDFTTQIEPLFQSAGYGCTNCHNATRAANEDLTTGLAYSNLVNFVSTTRAPMLRVKPYDVAKSLLPAIISAAHHNITVTAADQTTINAWIAQGALPVGANAIPIVLSPASATPDAAQAGTPVTFCVAAEDPTGGALTYDWDFGDGCATRAATGANSGAASHAYTAGGNYLAQVTISNVSTSVTSEVIVVVGSLPPGSDVSLSSDVGIVTIMTVNKFSAKVFFTKTGKDTCKVTGIVPNVPANFDPNQKQVQVTVGGVTQTFTLDEKGNAKTDYGSFKLLLKRAKKDAANNSIAFQCNMTGAYGPTWTQGGLNSSVTTRKAAYTIVVGLILDTISYTADHSGTLSSVADKMANLN